LWPENDEYLRPKTNPDPAHVEVLDRARAVTLERQEVLAGPEDRLDPLPDRREVEAVGGLVPARRAQDAGAELGDTRGELTGRIARPCDARRSLALPPPPTLKPADRRG